MRKIERVFSGSRLLRAPASMHPRVIPVMRTNALVSISDAFIRTNASFVHTSASFVRTSQLTSPQSSSPFMRTNASLVHTNDVIHTHIRI